MSQNCVVCSCSVKSRHDGYCSEKCRHEFITKINLGLEATTAWAPLAIEPITHIVSGYPIMVFSDIHAPLHSVKWISRGIQAAKHFGCKILIVNGDFIDANQISRHIGGYYRRKSELNDDFLAGEALLNIFAKEFEQVYFLNGNHCFERLIKVFRGEVQAQRLFKMFGEHKNVKISARSFIEVNDGVICGHPRQYSRIRGSLAQRIAMRHQRHIVLGHGHHSAMSVTADGKWQACDIGCMANLEQFEYTTFEINDMPQPLNGFGIIKGNRIQLFDDFTIPELFGLKWEQ